MRDQYFGYIHVGDTYFRTDCIESVKYGDDSAFTNTRVVVGFKSGDTIVFCRETQEEAAKLAQLILKGVGE
jgi:hypothetical protein